MGGRQAISPWVIRVNRIRPFLPFNWSRIRQKLDRQKPLNHRLQQRRPDQFRVIIVMSEIYAQKAVVEYVRQEGFRVSGFGDAKEAVRSFTHEHADLVIADLT